MLTQLDLVSLVGGTWLELVRHPTPQAAPRGGRGAGGGGGGAAGAGFRRFSKVFDGPRRFPKVSDGFLKVFEGF